MNNTKVKVAVLITSVIGLLFLGSCKEDENNSGTGNFDRKLLLENIADNNIIPNWAMLKVKTDSLETAIGIFTQSPTNSTLAGARAAWVSAYLQWQHCNAFTFGPAEKSILGTATENLGTWPINTTVVEERVQKADYNFDDFRRDSRGFLALDYLLFAPGALDSLVNSSAATNRKNYLQKVTENIKTWVDDVNTGWATYRNEFVNNTSKAAGSPTSNLYNEFVKSFEGIKNFKIGLPAGKRAGQTQAEPKLVEGYYSGLSVLFLKEHFKAIENSWRGVGTDGQNRTGFDDYLLTVTGGTQLKTETEAQIAAVNLSLQAIASNELLSALVISDLSRVENVHTEFQKMTRFFKSDLSSLLGIAITYSSGDGD